MIRVVFSFIVAILVSSSALMLRAQTNTAGLASQLCFGP